MLLKSRTYILAGLLGVVLIFALTVRNSTAEIAGGLHDLSIWGGTPFSYFEENPCIFCHTPHRANTNQTYTNNPNPPYGSTGNLNGRFLWNRALPANTFQPYTSHTYTFKNNPPQPGVFSLLCLSCHDGIGAMNVLLSRPSPVPDMGAGNYNQFGDFFNDPNIRPLNIGDAACIGDTCTGGTDLRNDHPVGFNYDDAASADSSIWPYNQLPSQLQARLTLTNRRMECNTCHNPHRTNGPSDRNKFLVILPSEGDICLACHNK
ncbi:MAG: cytochrome c3 family protein [Thermodesulfovibrionales bacterium]|nr:cytochrome c3 family protein [Thermodesulfovibrionales bacterium]